MNENLIDRDELDEIAKNVMKMRCILQDITEGYFDKYNPENDKDYFVILYDFKRNRIKADILSSCLFDMFNDLEKCGYNYWTKEWGGGI